MTDNRGIDRDRLLKTIGIALRSSTEQPVTGDRRQIAEKILNRIDAIALVQASGQLPKRTLDLAHVCIDPYNSERTVWQHYCDLFQACACGCAALNIPRLASDLFRYDDAIDGAIWVPDWVCRKLRTYAREIERETGAMLAQRSIERQAPSCKP